MDVSKVRVWSLLNCTGRDRKQNGIGGGGVMLYPYYWRGGSGGLGATIVGVVLTWMLEVIAMLKGVRGHGKFLSFKRGEGARSFTF